MRTLTRDTKIRLNQIKDLAAWIQDKHSPAHSGDIRRWADGKLHEKTAHGWRVLPNNKEYELKEDTPKKMPQSLPRKPATQEEFNNFVDHLYNRDYKDLPNVIRLPNITKKLAIQLGVDSHTQFILKPRYTHINPARKASEGQEFRKEEYKQIPNEIRYADHAYVDKDKNNFWLTFPDKKNPEMINKIVFTKTQIGGYLVTLGKVNKQESLKGKDIRLLKR